MNQKVQRSGVSLMELSYDYLRAGTSSGRTGQLTKITNNLDQRKDRGYEYDALGRLKRATGGSPNPIWWQDYTYDRYGNRTSVTASGIAANGSAIPRDGLANVSYNASTNRVNLPGWEYDAAGNLTRGQRADGVWQRYEYDAAGRLVKVRDDSCFTIATYTYGASNHRLIEQVGNESSSQRTYYVWEGTSVIAEDVEIWRDYNAVFSSEERVFNLNRTDAP